MHCRIGTPSAWRYSMDPLNLTVHRGGFDIGSHGVDHNRSGFKFVQSGTLENTSRFHCTYLFGQHKN